MTNKPMENVHCTDRTFIDAFVSADQSKCVWVGKKMWASEKQRHTFGLQQGFWAYQSILT